MILQGMLDSLRGEPMPQVEESAPADKADFVAMAAEDITFAFDTVFIVRKHTEEVDLEPFRTYLNSIGDSLVIGEDDTAFKVHVHTNTPAPPLPSPRSTAPWSWPRSRTCAPRPMTWRRASTCRAPTTWRRWRPNWRPAPTAGAGEGRPGEEVWLCSRLCRTGAGGCVP